MNEKSKGQRFLQLFICFFKVGAFTFGGGFAMIPLIEREIVDNKKWISEKEIIDVFAVAQSLPGAIAINTSTFIGYKVLGRLGAVVATAGVVLPSLITITLIAMFFSIVRGNPIFDAIFDGISPAIVALILVAGVKIAKESVKDKLGAIILLFTVIAITFFKVQAIFVIIAGALIGIIIYFFFPKLSKKIINREEDDIGIS
ncbi:chromate transporter [Paratissierella segnis]|jgi:chromate transporter|uniref:Chromate transporter n=1 Tax=Paratissierella segnis TaxID=2763679 RepID=A0A926IL33_9FIRM|nr:chromate transporter [Paratissierella segnis]MBC8589141.1 chromate transporter [Paratissierella segnis]